MISLTDNRHIPPEKIPDLAVDKNFIKYGLEATLLSVGVFPLGRVYNITYLPWKQSPAGAFDQISHFGIRIPFDVIRIRH